MGNEEEEEDADETRRMTEAKRMTRERQGATMETATRGARAMEKRGPWLLNPAKLAASTPQYKYFTN